MSRYWWVFCVAGVLLSVASGWATLRTNYNVRVVMGLAAIVLVAIGVGLAIVSVVTT